MLGRIAEIAVVVAVLAIALSHARAAEPPAETPPERGILVLRNGEILQGRITHADGMYVIDLPDGQIRLKDADVDLVCSSLEEGYRRKRATIQVGNVHDHLELAQWCLRHDLLGPAAVELADATAADPKNPMIAALQRRLKMATEPPAIQSPKGASASGPTNEELDRMVRGLPRGSVEMFTQSVQPVLMNHCTGSGCHGLQDDVGMRLIRISPSKSPSRRFTQRNLYSVLQYVDQDNPLASKLLTAASRPHGTVQHAMFSEHEAAQYKRLVEWVGQIVGRDMPETPATVASEAPAMAEASASEPPPRALPREARKARPMSPADPLDPEVFNRRYAPEKPPAKNPPQ